MVEIVRLSSVLYVDAAYFIQGFLHQFLIRGQLLWNLLSSKLMITFWFKWIEATFRSVIFKIEIDIVFWSSSTTACSLQFSQNFIANF